MSKNLEHLSEDEIETLIQRYYAGEAVTKLLKEYRLSVRVAELYKLFPPEVCKEEICEYCKEHLVRDRLPKTAVTRKYRDTEMYCPICKHRPYVENCSCEKCMEEKRLFMEFQKKRIEDVYSQKKSAIDFEDLSFEQKVCLGTICRALGKEDLHEIKPYNSTNVVLAPTRDLCSQIYKSLSRDEIIVVSPTSPIDAFSLDEDDFPYTYYVYKVSYYLNLKFPPNKKELFEEILNPTYYAPGCEEEALCLWKKLLLENVLNI